LITSIEILLCLAIDDQREAGCWKMAGCSVHRCRRAQSCIPLLAHGGPLVREIAM
jgi:hypothetical protein